MDSTESLLHQLSNGAGFMAIEQSQHEVNGAKSRHFMAAIFKRAYLLRFGKKS
ncbi:unnamed protein product [Ectocarpus sp. CCAP 1310/34]|nr:unnamed protein product [Ectocarpus sp. CCAP 1310/34]